MKSKVLLREMTEPEFKKLSAFSFENFVEESAKAARQPTEALRQKLGNPPGPPDQYDLWRIVESDGRQAGFFWIRLSKEKPSEAFGYDIYLDEEYRGQGLGRHTMLAGRALLRECGVKTLRVCVFGGNAIARKLYESLGFREVRHHAARNQHLLEIEV